MISAPIPINEAERLKALLEYEILDSLPETTFDDIAKLATVLCGTPMAAVCLIDSDRQWFKSAIGLEVRETPRDISFCGHAIHSPSVFEIPNAQSDYRFADNPLVVDGPKLNFYAAAPLISNSGYAIGTVCVADLNPRKLTSEQIISLECLSKLVVRELETRRSLAVAKGNFLELKRLTRTVDEQNHQLIQADKMKSLGEMAGGIAHEINTPLAIIQSHTNFLKRRAIEGNLGLEATKERLDKIEQTVSRISDIAKSMLAFSHDGNVANIKECKGSQIIEDSLSLIKGIMAKKNIFVTQSLGSDFQVFASPSMATQIIINLLMNAQHAVESLEKRWIRIGLRLASDGRHVEIYVMDSGQGIPAEIRSKIMDPFFTTKAAGTGTGLGLSISNTLAKAQGGRLWLDESQENTCFVLTLPCEKITLLANS